MNFDIIYVHNKETGEVSRKEFDTVDYGVEDVYAFDGDSKRALRITAAEELPNEVEYYFHSEERQGRPIRNSEPHIENGE